MKLFEYLDSPLLPRQEKMPDVFSRQPYWALPDKLCVYTYGFNHTTGDKQSKPLIDDLQDMTPEKFDLLQKYKECEVKGVQIFSADDYKTIVHVLVEVK